MCWHHHPEPCARSQARLVVTEAAAAEHGTTLPPTRLPKTCPDSPPVSCQGSGGPARLRATDPRLPAAGQRYLCHQHGGHQISNPAKPLEPACQGDGGQGRGKREHRHPNTPALPALPGLPQHEVRAEKLSQAFPSERGCHGNQRFLQGNGKKRKTTTTLGRIWCRKTETERFWQLRRVGGEAAPGQQWGPSAHSHGVWGHPEHPMAQQHLAGVRARGSPPVGSGVSLGPPWSPALAVGADPDTVGGHSPRSRGCLLGCPPPSCPLLLPRTPLLQPLTPAQQPGAYPHFAGRKISPNHIIPRSRTPRPHRIFADLWQKHQGRQWDRGLGWQRGTGLGWTPDPDEG